MNGCFLGHALTRPSAWQADSREKHGAHCSRCGQWEIRVLGVYKDSYSNYVREIFTTELKPDYAPEVEWKWPKVRMNDEGILETS